MLRKSVLALVLLSSSWFANAKLIQSITGEDMAGMLVTATFGNGTSQTVAWEATGADAGAAAAFSWSLSQTGNTIGDFDGTTIFGIWTLASNRNIVSLTVDAFAGDVIFDTEFGDPFANGSGDGREFTYDDTLATVSAAFSDNYMDELFGTMTLTGLNGNPGNLLIAGGSSLEFLIDTDLIHQVPEPATLFFFMSGLIALVVSRKKVAGK
jgi:hypothetical protein